MSAFSFWSAYSERCTALHRNDAVAVLHYYVRGAALDGEESAGFPVSGDMLATLEKGTQAVSARRRRLVSRVCLVQEAGA